MKASPEAQRTLLSVQELDTRIRQLDHAASRLPQLERIAELGSRRDE